MEPSLEFWHQLVQLMPAVQKVDFTAMHESLQLMAEQPWARWLDITIYCDFEASQPPASSYSGDELPLCWQAGSWVKAGVFKVTMISY
ncbi:hypothetical protein HaLaN_10137 [Haematococcus lacustris]|uniref:Uncharacterized protein n=1 Tax=Haematococcus lacustris TaxID=44745 RepID=A0A699YWQ4_HAELA|nr:hypothetical protein HaLaN_10137 [Haematococcus lacustris]